MRLRRDAFMPSSPKLYFFGESIAVAYPAVNALRCKAARRLCGRQAHRPKLGRLALGDAIEREILDRFIEQFVEVQLRAQVQKHRTKPDRGAINEHEFARHGDGALLLECLVHTKGFAPAVFRRPYSVGDGAHAIVKERRIDEARPDIERVDQIALELAEAPSLIGVHDEIVVAFEQAVIKIDDAADEFRREDADAAIVEQLDARGLLAAREH